MRYKLRTVMPTMLLAAVGICAATVAGVEDTPRMQLIGSPSSDGATFLRASDTMRAGVFYDVCQEASPPDVGKKYLLKEKYVLVVSASGQFAYMFDVIDGWEEGPAIVNVATLALKAGELKVSETMGGVGTYLRSMAVAAQLLKEGFTHTFDYSEPLARPPSVECVPQEN